VGNSKVFDTSVPEVVVMASGVIYGGDCELEGVIGVATTLFEDRFCERRGVKRGEFQNHNGFGLEDDDRGHAVLVHRDSRTLNSSVLRRWSKLDGPHRILFYEND
jgi:hypothetical protein